MSVYLKDDTVVLNSGNVATSQDCCCITGACCVGTDCTIETESNCIGMGGTYQGDDIPCDPNPCPCICGGFLNPDDGLYYNTKIYTNTPTLDCPDAGGCCIDFFTGTSCCFPWTGARWYFRSFCHENLLSQETFDSECNLVQTFEDVPLDVYFEGHCKAEGGGSGCEDCDCEETDCEFQACPPVDPCVPGWLSCTSVNTVISYENPCIP